VVLLFLSGRQQHHLHAPVLLIPRSRRPVQRARGACGWHLAQDIASHRHFIAKHGLTLPLLADSNHDVSKLYDVHSSVIGTKRATIVIDERGVVRYRHDNLLSLSYDSVNDLSTVLARLS